jgi:hypothetical protein
MVRTRHLDPCSQGDDSRIVGNSSLTTVMEEWPVIELDLRCGRMAGSFYLIPNRCGSSGTHFAR